ncbi:unnamed protein product [Pseudo-nitzschia multistriata]|uniref:Uncharacterized protein n=1 Tax=Pseudo-nitzschia multistriata TaxID=183589 RepID=A0A448ZCJ7_9STRA|nr:unnamed protein product [Pseudo-nitzschia multistriata]
MNHLLLRAGIFVAAILCTNASSSTGKIGQNGPLPKFPLMGVTSDPFIEFSPMVVGVVCRDGVLLFAVHSIFSKDNAELPLLRDSIGEESCTDNSENRSNNTRVAAFQKDLPRRYRGPFRIHPVDSSCASAMVCSGWRTDCQNLINHIRSIDRREQLEFGHHIGTAPEYGSFLASQASLLMAKFCVSESRRPLSCLGLLASGSCLGLWVVDATGAYRVRAHALGQGSDRMNEILRKVDWTQRDSNGVKDELLRLLYSDSVHDSDDENSSSEIKIPEGSCIEMAVIEKPTRKAPNTMKRLFASL